MVEHNLYMETKEETAPPSLREILAARGFVVKPDLLSQTILKSASGAILKATGCSSSKCNHGSGPIPGGDFIDATLNRSRPNEDCLLFIKNHASRAHPELAELHDLSTKVFRTHEDLINLLNTELSQWDSGWDKFLVPSASDVSLEKINEAWFRSSIKTHKNLLLGAFMSWMEESGGREIPSQPVDPEPLMLLEPFHKQRPVRGQLLCEELFGPSGLTGVIKVPARFVHTMPFKVACLKYSVWDMSTYRGELAADDTVWFIGDRPFREPALASDAHTSTVLETAAVLRENMPLKQALDAAVEV